jgi:predicted RNA-binding protein with PIN domain
VLIVDAFNVLHASAKAGLGRIDVARLKALIEHSHWGGEHVVLVFDGPGGPSSPARTTLRRAVDAGLDLESRASGISDVYAAGGAGHADADSVIESLLEREEQMGRGRLAMVVSSDKRVRAAATGARAKSITSEEFLRKLADDVRKAHARAQNQHGGRPGFATDEGVDAGRTEYWLREFGLGVDGKPDTPPTPPRPPAVGGDRTPAKSEREEWGGKIDADDLDMDKILRQMPPKPSREEDDHDPPPPSRRSRGR